MGSREGERNREESMRERSGRIVAEASDTSLQC